MLKGIIFCKVVVNELLLISVEMIVCWEGYLRKIGN